jgi:ABC-type phosphate transport system substrate-binding protein
VSGGIRNLPTLAAALLTAAMVLAPALARAEVVVIVAAKSPIVSLSLAEIADVFLGRLTRLPDGTRPMPLDQAENSPLRNEMYNKVARMSPIQVKSYWAKLIFTGRGFPPRALPSDQDVLLAVRDNLAAIGYIERRLADSSVRILY